MNCVWKDNHWAERTVTSALHQWLVFVPSLLATFVSYAGTQEQLHTNKISQQFKVKKFSQNTREQQNKIQERTGEQWRPEATKGVLLLILEGKKIRLVLKVIYSYVPQYSFKQDQWRMDFIHNSSSVTSCSLLSSFCYFNRRLAMFSFAGITCKLAFERASGNCI